MPLPVFTAGSSGSVGPLSNGLKKSSVVNSELVINIPKILELTEEKRLFIVKLINMYFDSFNGTAGHIVAGGMKLDSMSSKILEATLIRYSYLINERESKINDIIE